MKVLVAITGASGTIYARQLLDALSAATDVERIGLIISSFGEQVAQWEDAFPTFDAQPASGMSLRNGVISASAAPDSAPWQRIERFANDDMFASPASGSAGWDAMVVVPASMGCVGRIAGGVSSDLIARAADVMLKEGRRLVVVPRETPFSIIHLRNMTTLAEAGAVILPASPSFYSRPGSIEDLCATVTERILSRLGIAHEGYKWGDNR